MWRSSIIRSYSVKQTSHPLPPPATCGLGIRSRDQFGNTVVERHPLAFKVNAKPNQFIDGNRLNVDGYCATKYDVREHQALGQLRHPRLDRTREEHK